MTTADLLGQLNRRHRVALFLTLVATGLTLVLGGTIKETVGAVFLGMAVAWAFGSNSRTVHWLFFASGFLVLVAPLVAAWVDHRIATKTYEGKIAAFESRIPELSNQHPYKNTATNRQSGARMGCNGAMWVVLSPGTGNQLGGDEWDTGTDSAGKPQGIDFSCVMSLPRSGTREHRVGDEWDGKRWISEPDTPKWVCDALAAGVDVDSVPEFEKPAYFPPKPFSLVSSLDDGLPVVLLGVFLAALGMGLLVWIKR